MNIEKKIEQLREAIRQADRLYYIEASPEISDQEYDKMFAELKKLEGEHPEFLSADSPTQRVSGEPLTGFDTVTHNVAMLSMDNTYSAGELRDFDGRVHKGLPDESPEYVVETKIDGVAITIKYINGVLALAATRGDGKKGDDITANAKTIASLPLVLDGNVDFAIPEVLEVRGEVYMTFSAFDNINRQREENGEPLFANPRNATAGSLKLLESRKVAQRKLSVLLYGLGEVSDTEFSSSHFETLEKLKQLGLPVSPNYSVVPDIDKVIEHCDAFQEKRAKLPYPIDGMVIKVNSYLHQKILGFTSRSPRWSIAYKFAAEQAQTIVRNISVQVGKSGALTPVADLEPVPLAGTTVKRASLHNFEELARKDVRIGDTVKIEKAGEIIPQVIEVVTELRPAGTKEFSLPEKCPVCGGETAKDENGVFLRCVNPGCPAQLIERLKYFAGRDQMDIDGLGAAIIEQLVSRNMVESFADLYRLNIMQLANLDRMGTKSAENLLNGLETSMSRPLDKFIAALGIMHVGTKAAENLAEYFHTLEKLREADIEELQNVPDIGQIVAQSIYEFFHNEITVKMVDDLLDAGVCPPEYESQKKDISELPLGGMTIVVTGTIEGYDRKEMEKAIKSLGGKPSGSVSKKTSILVYGEKAGSKLKKAEELNVTAMVAEEFIKKYLSD